MIIPVGFERFFAVIAARGLGEDDPDAIDAAAAEFGLEILGPPPP